MRPLSFTDLKERGLLDSTLVIWMGEFGRGPGNGQQPVLPAAASNVLRLVPASRPER